MSLEGDQKVQFVEAWTSNHRAAKLLRAGVPFFVVKASEPYARQVVALIKANEGTNWTAECEAWAESVLPAPPAGEVTADAVEVASQVLHDSKFQFSHPRMGIKTFLWHEASEEWKENARKEMQAALAAAFPALVQQVERLRIDVAASHSCLNELSAENARLAKDAERYGTLRSSQVKQSQYSNFFQSVNDDCNPPYLELKHGADLDAAVDAATAQANQAEGDNV